MAKRKKAADQAVHVRDDGSRQVVASDAQIIEKLQRYIAGNPKGPKAAQYRKRLRQLKGKSK